MRDGVKHRWRDYRTLAGHRPVRDYIRTLPEKHSAAVFAAMKEVAREGLGSARHLRGDLYEVRADVETHGYRILFALEGRKGRILLALEGFSKKTQRTPDNLLKLAERRLADWRSSARH